MPIKSLSQSSLLSFQKYSSLLAGNAAYSPSSYDLIQSEILTSSQASVTFDVTGLGSTYQHLQLRIVVRHADSTAGVPDLLLRFNSDTNANYSWHTLYGNGSSVASAGYSNRSNLRIGQTPKNNETVNSFQVAVVDVLDAFETTKYKTIKTLTGRAQTTNDIELISGNWRNTAAITSLEILPDSSNVITGSRFSLYGVR